MEEKLIDLSGRAVEKVEPDENTKENHIESDHKEEVASDHFVFLCIGLLGNQIFCHKISNLKCYDYIQIAAFVQGTQSIYNSLYELLDTRNKPGSDGLACACCNLANYKNPAARFRA